MKEERRDEEGNNAVIATRRNNRGTECTSDPVWRRSIITVTDISRRADPAATAAIWHLRGVNWYLERYYVITMYTCIRECEGERDETADKLRYRQNCEHRQLIQCWFILLLLRADNSTSDEIAIDEMPMMFP